MRGASSSALRSTSTVASICFEPRRSHHAFLSDAWTGTNTIRLISCRKVLSSRCCTSQQQSMLCTPQRLISTPNKQRILSPCLPSSEAAKPRQSVTPLYFASRILDKRTIVTAALQQTRDASLPQVDWTRYHLQVLFVDRSEAHADTPQ